MPFQMELTLGCWAGLDNLVEKSKYTMNGAANFSAPTLETYDTVFINYRNHAKDKNRITNDF
jgi:hypothetical protein